MAAESGVSGCFWKANGLVRRSKTARAPELVLPLPVSLPPLSKMKTHRRGARDGTLEPRFRNMAFVAATHHCHRNCHAIFRPRSRNTVCLGGIDQFPPHATRHLAGKIEARAHALSVNCFSDCLLGSGSNALGGGRPTVEHCRRITALPAEYSQKNR